MSTADPGASALATRAPSRSSSSSSSSSRGVSHGVGLAVANPISSRPSGRRTTRLSALMTPSAPLEQRVDLVGVVVARNQVERRAALVEALRGQLHPRRQPILDRLEKALLEDARVVELGELLIGHGDGVEALVGQRPLDLPELVLVPGDPLAPAVTAVPASVGAHERNERLAREIACDEHRIRFPDAEADRVQQLPPGDLGGMQIGGDQEPHGQSGRGTRSSAPGRVRGRCGSVWYQNATDVSSSGRLFACPCSIETTIDSLNGTGSSMWKR